MTNVLTEEEPLKKQIFSIPNMLGYFRILLIPFFICSYLEADSTSDYRLAAFIIGVSGITDFLDGFIARKFHMVTRLGKVLDPIADKLTQAALVFALSFRFHFMIALMIVFTAKEGFMGIAGVLLMRRGKMLDGAMWFGKICTAALYLVMFILILFPNITMGIANGLILACTALLLFSFIKYVPLFLQKLRRD